jgi:bacteriocin-like protein
MEKARECKTSNDLVELAKNEGIELTDEQLDAISGGTWYNCMNETW